MKSLVCQQNRHQKFFKRGVLHSEIWTNIPVLYCFLFQFGGGLELCFGGAKPNKAPPPRGDATVWQNFSLLYAIDSEKYLRYAICQACKICQTSCLYAWQGPTWCCNLSVGIALNCVSPRTGCERRITAIYMWHEQAIIEWSWWVISNNACEASEQLMVLTNGDDKSDLVISFVACCHSVKLCAFAAQAFWLQQGHNAFRQVVTYSASWSKTCVGTILPSFEHNWLKWSCDKCNTRRQLVGV